jgi:hypothetical protein
MRHRSIARYACAGAVVLAALTGCGGGSGEEESSPAFPTILAVGDIVGCEVGRDEATAEVAAANPGTPMRMGRFTISSIASSRVGAASNRVCILR